MAPILSVSGLSRIFGRPDGSGRLLPGCHDIGFDLAAGETIGIVGESGSGKTTLGRCIAGLERPDAGEIRVASMSIAAMDAAARRRLRRTVQIVFQNPETALNPHMTAGRFVAEPLRNFGLVSRAGERARLAELAGMVGLRTEHLDRYPHQLSGGQKQRVGLMRALACEPEIVVLDEPTSALDVSVQAQVLVMLREIQARTGVAFLLISHDVAVIRSVARRVLVMYLGRVVESGPVEAVLGSPRHPYTRALIDAVPRLRGEPADPFRLSGDISLREVAAESCPLRPRCPLAFQRCTTLPPAFEPARGHAVRCWRSDPAAPEEGAGMARDFCSA